MNKYPVFDGHNDTLLSLLLPEDGEERSFFEESEHGHIDLPRAKRAGFAGGFFAMFVPNPPDEAQPKSDALTYQGKEIPMPTHLKLDYAQQYTNKMFATLIRLERESAGDLKIVGTVAEIEACIADGTIAAIPHFEGAEAIDADFEALEVYYQAGLRSLGPVWSRNNIFANGVPFKFGMTPDIGGGLTDSGKALVEVCNELGIMIDLSHMNEAGFWDVADISDAPLVATHSNVHAICAMARNLTDKQLDAIKDSDGIVGLNFGVGFVHPEAARDPHMPIEMMVRHLDYMIERVGVERVAFGSDFDGTTITSHIGDVTGLAALIAALEAAGYDEDTLKKLTHENWLRVLRLTWGA